MRKGTNGLRQKFLGGRVVSYILNILKKLQVYKFDEQKKNKTKKS